MLEIIIAAVVPGMDRKVFLAFRFHLLRNISDMHILEEKHVSMADCQFGIFCMLFIALQCLTLLHLEYIVRGGFMTFGGSCDLLHRM